jgi:hypothetical protein
VWLVQGRESGECRFTGRFTTFQFHRMIYSFRQQAAKFDVNIRAAGSRERFRAR